MDFANYFVLPDGRLRAGWRLLLFLVFFVVAALLFNGLLSVWFKDKTGISQTALLAARSMAGLSSVCVATWLMMSLLEHQSFWDVGLRASRQSVRELGLGLASGAVLVGTSAFVEWSLGAVVFETSSSGTVSTWAVLAAGSGIFVLSATAEELLFRGYPFQRLIEGTNVYVALGVASVIFGWLHKPNPNSTTLSVVNTVLAGILLSLAYWKSRALWLPIGFHFSWNWTLAITGFPVSGVELVRMPWQAAPSSPHLWIHGGGYGPEGGLVATGVLVLGVILLFRVPGKSSGPIKSPGDGPLDGSSSL